MEKEILCPNCKKALIFDENLDSYFCMDCNEYFPRSDFEVKEENAFTGKYKELACLMCGKRIVISNNFNYDICPFCYNNLIDIKEEVKGFKPNFIIPFKDTIESFKASFFQKAKQANVPANLLANISEDSIKGVFVPCYVYTVENDAKGFFQTREVDSGYDDFSRQRITYIENIDVIVDTTEMISNREMSEFANYDLKKIDMFFPERLKDFYTLIPVLTVDTAWDKMKKAVTEHIESDILKLKGKHEEIKELKTFNSVKNLSRRMVLLPVWMLESHIGEEVHHIYVNGQTDKMVSDVEFEQVVKKTFFGKKIIENYQVRVLERENYKRTEFRSSIEYLNELRKYEINQNDRLANIRKVR